MALTRFGMKFMTRLRFVLVAVWMWAFYLMVTTTHSTWDLATMCQFVFLNLWFVAGIGVASCLVGDSILFRALFDVARANGTFLLTLWKNMQFVIYHWGYAPPDITPDIAALLASSSPEAMRAADFDDDDSDAEPCVEEVQPRATTPSAAPARRRRCRSGSISFGAIKTSYDHGSGDGLLATSSSLQLEEISE